jgi:hypothetical protein
LPASKPGLDAGAHDQYKDYLTVSTPRQRAVHVQADTCLNALDNVAARTLSPPEDLTDIENMTPGEGP